MTVNEYKEFIKNRYDEEPSESMIKRFCEINDIPYGMVINERMVAKTCENHGIEYQPPPDGGACWDLWGGTIELRECEA
jgi:hypothetical protein